jgi:hypothetical protein
MDARSVVESALQAMIAQDIQGHMRWVDDNVAVDSPATLPRTSKLQYLQEYSLVLAPGTGIRLSRYEVMYAGSPGPDGEWVRTMLTFEVTKDGGPFPTSPVDYVTQQSEAWYAVRGDRIVRVKTMSVPQAWHFARK